jgi:hypothetical protein
VRCQVWKLGDRLHGLYVERSHNGMYEDTCIVLSLNEIKGAVKYHQQLVLKSSEVVPTNCGRPKPSVTCPCFKCKSQSVRDYEDVRTLTTM